MKRRTAVCLLVAVASILLFADAEGIRVGVGEALSLCGSTVIPSQFLFLVISSLLVSLGIGEVLAPRLEGLMWPLFRVDGAGATALILGLVGGYPIGARTTVALYREHLVSQSEAERLLAFCNNANPAFLISVLGVGVFKSVRVGLWLWLIHLLSSLLTGILFRSHGAGAAASRRHIAARVVPFVPAFVGAVGQALGSILNICAFVVVFYVLARPLLALHGATRVAAVGFLELFSVIPLLSADRASFVLVSILSGWGGLSVLCQTLAILSGSDLSWRSCLLGKLVQAGLSGVLALALAGFVLP